MELNQYQEQAMTTCTESSRNVPYMLLNLGAEFQELSDKLKTNEWATTASFDALCEEAYSGSEAGKVAKAIRKGEVPVPYLPQYTDEEKEAMKYEAGDILWQLSGLCSVMDWDLEAIAQMNLDKLKNRQDRGTIIGEGDNR